MGSLWGGLSGITAFLTVFNNFAWFFGYLGGQPQLNARFMGMKDEKNVRVGRNIAILWTILAYGGAIFIGVCALALFGRNAVTDTEMILPHAIMKIFPWWISAILLAGIVAAMVSTAESMLIVCATSISQDFYNGILKKGKGDEKTVLRISRLVTLGVGLLGLGLSLSTSKLIYTVVGYAWAGIGCSFAPAVLLSFFWKKMNGAGIVTALGAGLVTTVIWILTGLDSIVTARGVTFFVSLASAILVSILFNRKKSQKSICL
jgi:sodium/proline symporter